MRKTEEPDKCACGGYPDAVCKDTVVGHFEAIKCRLCGRQGELREKATDAVTSWNADRRAKADRDDLVQVVHEWVQWEALLISDGYPGGPVDKMSLELCESMTRLQVMRNRVMTEIGERFDPARVGAVSTDTPEAGASRIE